MDTTISSPSSASSAPRCIVCEEDEPSAATVACKDCDIYLCDFDALMHKGTPATGTHNMIRLKPLFLHHSPVNTSLSSINTTTSTATTTTPTPPTLPLSDLVHKDKEKDTLAPLLRTNDTPLEQREVTSQASKNIDTPNTTSPVQGDEEAFIDFVREFKYNKDKSSPQSDGSDEIDEDEEPEVRVTTRPTKKRRDEGNEDVRSWEANFEKLVEFKDKYGNCYVPYDWQEDPAFAQWVSRQRVFKNKGRLSPDRIAELEKIGFLWSANEAGAFKMRWEQRLDELKQYKAEFGTCAVPYRWAKNTQLANWVFRQREHRKAGKLSEDRIVQLDDVGFLWGVDISVSKDNRWELKYTELKEFKAQNGHCRVPNAYRVNQQLANWVRKQRELRKKGRLTSDRVSRLDNCDFVWEIGQGKPSRDDTKKRKADDK